ncbi:unnamed protein product [Cuscuta campestris]|uniref:Retrotransposon gag domain-containing protein n=1 Tax=Cuscuta campestris TaxID=132261 RepID=A0A484N393_9ASTE|nr:unnamed protein product [Cuscuta campestris]
MRHRHQVRQLLSDQGDMVMRFFDEKGLGAKVLRLKGQAARHLEMPWRDAKTIHDYGVTTMRHMETYMGQSLRKWECVTTRSAGPCIRVTRVGVLQTPSTFVPRMVPIRPVNLTKTMNETAPSNVHEIDEAEQEAARRRKGKAIAKPSKTRDSVFKRLGDKEDGPRKSAKLRLGPEMGRTSEMERLGGSRHAQSHRSRESETIHQDEEEAESQPRASAYTRLSYDEDDLDKIGSVARKLRALEEKVEEKAGAKKHTLARSPFSARVHAQKLRRKIKLDLEKFTGKEDPNVHLDTFHNAAQMAGCTNVEECLLFFSSLRGRPVEWFNGLPHGRIGSFEKLAEVFRKKYQDNYIKRKKFTYLNMVGQKEKEFIVRISDQH